MIMNISEVNNISFNVRSPKLREPEKVLRIMSSEFPALSGTKMAEFKNAYKFQLPIEMINYTITTDIKECVLNQENNIQRALTLIQLVKSKKLANCGDFSELCAIICKVNGIDVIRPLLVSVSKKGKIEIVDHSILMIKPKKEFEMEEMGHLNEIIIDPWLGFTDFAKNVKLNFMGEYSKFFKFKKGTRLLIDCKNHTIIRKNDELCELIKQMYPQFIIKKPADKKTNLMSLLSRVILSIPDRFRFLVNKISEFLLKIINKLCDSCH